MRLLRKTIYPYAKFPYHRFLAWRGKRRIAAHGEAAVVRENFYRNHGFWPNLENPQTFNEKLAWLKLNVRDPLMVSCADKYAVRQYVSEKLGEEHLIPLLGVYERVSDIPFDDLPAPFVLKVTHASHGNVFCLENGSFDRQKAVRFLRHHLGINPYYYDCEWPYRDVPPRVVCEKVLYEDGSRFPKDYKVFCFNGEPVMIHVDVDRFGEHRRNVYDSEWNLIPVRFSTPNANHPITKPLKLDEMLRFARVLAAPFDLARIDLYCIDQHVYVGEITFFPGGGLLKFEPAEFELEFGARLRLDKHSPPSNGRSALKPINAQP